MEIENIPISEIVPYEKNPSLGNPRKKHLNIILSWISYGEQLLC